MAHCLRQYSPTLDPSLFFSLSLTRDAEDRRKDAVTASSPDASALSDHLRLFFPYISASIPPFPLTSPGPPLISLWYDLPPDGEGRVTCSSLDQSCQSSRLVQSAVQALFCQPQSMTSMTLCAFTLPRPGSPSELTFSPVLAKALHAWLLEGLDVRELGEA